MMVRDGITIKEALELMRCEHVNRLPVVDADGVLQGILSIKEVVASPEKRRGRKDARPFLSLIDEGKGRSARRAHPGPVGFDEKGRSPLERVFSDGQDD